MIYQSQSQTVAKRCTSLLVNMDKQADHWYWKGEGNWCWYQSRK